MDPNKQNDILGFGGPPSPSMTIPATQKTNPVLSPYLNFDPSILATGGDSDFIFPEGVSHRRGRFEFAFAQIGGSVLTGGVVGGATGLFNGVRETQSLTGPVRRTQLLNFVTKRGASTAQALGIVALMYSIFGVGVSWARGADDEINTLASAGATGMLYKSSAGLRPSLIGGGVGVGLAAAYCLVTSRDRVYQMLNL